ncbi:MAG: hypothetical protein JNM19_01545 [Chitinophagaceae bacterium]|nr:hypothetical protein [Chitinophagaceae bacterium]
MNAVLETGISLVLIFFIFSIVTYVIQELIAVNLKYRSKMLWKSMWQLFDGEKLEGRMQLLKALPQNDTDTTKDFYNHPQIQSLKKNLNDNTLPSYIPAANFALAVMNLIAAKADANKDNTATVSQTTSLDDIRAGLQKFVDSKGNLYAVIKNLLDTSSTLQELQQKIEDWFNGYMKRVSGWYESHIIISIRIIAVALTLIFNINVIKLAKKIYTDGELRTSLVAMAERVVDKPDAVTQYYTSSFNSISKNIDSIYQQQLDADTTLDGKKKILAEKATVLDSLAGVYTKKNSAAMRSLVSQLDSTGLPLGWKGDSLKAETSGKPGSNPLINILLMIIGWTIGACCISMGAPFWFDMLNKLVNVRRTVV